MRALIADRFQSHSQRGKSAKKRLVVSGDKIFNAFRRSGDGGIVYFLRCRELLSNIPKPLCELWLCNRFGERLAITK